MCTYRPRPQVTEVEQAEPVTVAPRVQPQMCSRRSRPQATEVEQAEPTTVVPPDQQQPGEDATSFYLRTHPDTTIFVGDGWFAGRPPEGWEWDQENGGYYDTDPLPGW